MNKKHVVKSLMSIVAANNLAACNTPMTTPDLKNNQAIVEKLEKSKQANKEINRYSRHKHDKIRIIINHEENGTKILIGPDETVAGRYNSEGSRISEGAKLSTPKSSVYGSYGNYNNGQSQVSPGSSIYGSYGKYNSSEGSRLESSSL